MSKQLLEELSLKYPDNLKEVEVYVRYCQELKLEKNKGGYPKNAFMHKITVPTLVSLFTRVAQTGFFIDGKNITLQSPGRVALSYVAYKNMMLRAYPETKIDVGIVYDKDDFTCSKEDGNVTYIHKVHDPFGNDKEIVGGYCVIKNNRGEFLTTLNKQDIEKHRKVAKTDYIWSAWYEEMVRKTLIKKGCKFHYEDIYQDFEEIDNENYQLENPLDIDIEIKKEIDQAVTNEDLQNIYMKNKGVPSVLKYLAIKKEQIHEDT